MRNPREQRTWTARRSAPQPILANPRMRPPPFFAAAAVALLALAGCTSPGAATAFEPAASAEANVRAALRRIEALNPRLNAVIATDPTAVGRARALDRSLAADGRRGPLFGVPVLVKDNVETAGPLPTTAGSLALVGNVTDRDAPLVARLRAAGAVVVGKASLSEWGNIRGRPAVSGWSAVGGQGRNPHALDRNPCGSSSGSAIAVAAGMVPAAIGTETDGSITAPASICGIVGLKPTVGLVSRTHIIPISRVQDTAGPLTRTVREAAVVLSAMAGTDPADPATAEADRRRTDHAAALSADALRGKRVGVLRFATGFGTQAAFERALKTLRDEGAVLVDIDAFEHGEAINRNELPALLAEFKVNLNAYLSAAPPAVRTRSLAEVIAFNKAHADAELALFGQELFEEAERTKGLDDPEYKKARETASRLAGPEGIDRLLKEHDVVALVGPTVSAAWRIDTVHGDQSPGGGAGSLPAVAGYPHLTVPMGTVKGLPVGLSFIGPKWGDGLVLSLGYDYEQAARQRIDPLFVPSVEERPEVAPLLRPAAAR